MFFHLKLLSLFKERNYMKRSLTILFLFAALAGFCQTKIDTLVFEKINSYRESKHLSKLVWCDIYAKDAKSHISFLNTEAKLSHSKRDPGVGEVICDISGVYNISDDSAESKYADRIVEAWKSSKHHNAILLNKKIKSMGVSSQISKNKTGFVKTFQLKGKTVAICK